MRSQAYIPQILAHRGNTLVQNALSVIGGVVLLSLLAQIAIPLPFTPIPMTGQIFGVSLIALLWGASRSSAIFSLYILVGAAGFPVFAQGQALTWGPRLGYLAGMLVASMLTGRLADRGWSRSFTRAFMAANLGLVCTYAIGLWGLSYFLPKEALLGAGLFPFLLGDLFKNFLAASLAAKIRN